MIYANDDPAAISAMEYAHLGGYDPGDDCDFDCDDDRSDELYEAMRDDKLTGDW